MAHELRRGSDPPPFDDALRSLDSRISRLTTDSSAFLEALDELLILIGEWPPMTADDLLQKAMLRLEMELKKLLNKGDEYFDLACSSGNFSDGEEDGVCIDGDGEPILVARPVNDYNILIELLPAETVGELNEIAKRMVLAGHDYEKECSRTYIGNRREFLEESLSRLGVQKVSVEEVQRMDWDKLEGEIERWIISVNVALRILFPSERRLCERVFSGYPSTSDVSFMEVCKDSVIQLLNFANAVAISSRSPERLFKVLHMYETVGNLMTEFELLFSNESCAILRTEAATIWKRLGESIRGIFMELANQIRRDRVKMASPGGGVHPITRYVMNYLRAACRSRQTLEAAFEEGAASWGEKTTSLYVQIAWIMELLDSNLEANSRVYKDTSLSYLFMMNNGNYILQKIEDSDLRELLGEDWIKKQSAKMGMFHVNYQKSSWNKVIASLKLDNAVSAASDLRDRINLFNTLFDETCKAQSLWIVAEDQLREEIKVAVAEALKSAYRKFFERFPKAERYVKYSVEEVEARISDQLFQGSEKKK